MPDNRDDPLYQLLQHGRIEEFNAMLAQGRSCDLRGADLRGLDLRHINVRGLDMRDCQLSNADLRGIDFSETSLNGASIKSARIAGALFPVELDPEEINLSLLHGTRMRYR